VIGWTMQTPASQGRLLFGALAPLSMGLAAGLLAWSPARAQWAAALALGAGLAVVAAVIPLADIAPRYAPPRPLSDSALPAGLRPIHAQIGEEMELVGYTADEAPRTPGQAQPVTLYWRALAPMEKDYALALVLFGRGMESVGQIDTWPGAGLLPTSQWRPGALYADNYQLPIADASKTPTLLKLSLSSYDGDPARRLPIRIPDGTTVDALTFPVGRLIPAQSPSVSPRVADNSTFEYGLALVGYDAQMDGALSLTLYWRPDQAIPADYTVFVHLVDQDGVPVVPPADAPPLGGDWPTSAWVPGQPVVDERLIALPPDRPPDCCSIRLGWYDPATGARLAAFRPDGTPWEENAVVLRLGDQ
jgi:hypothetical protein